MELRVYTDGGSLNNPGKAACSFVIYQQEKIIKSGAFSLGVATNNVAEYQGMIFALREIVALFSDRNWPERIICYSDSSLMVNQLNGVYKIKNKILQGFVSEIKKTTDSIGCRVVFQHVPREKNTVADALVKRLLAPGF